MIRVLQVFNSVNCGGAENLFVSFFRNLKSRGIIFDFVVHESQKGFLADDITKLGGKIFVAPNYRNIIKYKKFWKKLFCESNYACIHGNFRKTAFIYLKIAKKCGIKTIFHSHSCKSSNLFSRIFVKFLGKKIFKCSDKIFGCSQESLTYIFNNYDSNNEKFEILPNAIDINKFEFSEISRKQIRNSLKIQENDKVLIHVGRFIPVKNQVFLIKTFKELISIDSCNKIYLIFLGDGPTKISMQNLASRLMLDDRILFLGNRRNVADYLSSADIFVFPSIREGLPLSLVEAQACSLPCLASDSVDHFSRVCDDLVSFASLEQSFGYWAKKISDTLSIKKQRISRKLDFRNSRFNFSSVLDYLYKTYTSFGEKYEKNRTNN